MVQDLKRRQDADRALREERAFVTRPRDPGRPHTVPRPFALHGASQQVRASMDLSDPEQPAPATLSAARCIRGVAFRSRSGCSARASLAFCRNPQLEPVQCRHSPRPLQCRVKPYINKPCCQRGIPDDSTHGCTQMRRLLMQSSALCAA